MKPKRLAIFISGGGTTMTHVLAAIREGKLKNVVPSLILSSRKNAGGIEKALALGMHPDDVIVLRRRDYVDEEAFGTDILTECFSRNIDLIFQCGWLAHTPDDVIHSYAGNIYNQHPGALDCGYLGFGGPGMYGMRMHYVALEFAKATKRWWTEATVHRVTEKYDEGVVVGTMPIPVYAEDTPESLQQRVLPQEHDLVVKVLQEAVNGSENEWPCSHRLIKTPEEAWLLGHLMAEAAKAYPHG